MAQTTSNTPRILPVPTKTLDTTIDKAPNGSLKKYHGLLRTTELDGANVYIDQGTAIGTVHDLLVDDDGKVLAEIADRPGLARGLPDCADAGAVSVGLADGLTGGRGAPEQQIHGEAKRGRRRPDPLVVLTAQLHDWFEAEPWRTARELLEHSRLNSLDPTRSDSCELCSVGSRTGAGTSA